MNVAFGSIHDSTGSPTTIVHAIRDVSARKDLDRQKDDFLSAVAHDLKNPLTSIRGHAQLAILRLKKGRHKADDLHGLEVIDSQVGRMLDLIDRLLDLTRVQMGRLELRRAPGDLFQLVERVVEHVRVTASDRDILVEAPYHPLTGKWDRLAIERVLVNLLENAVKYSPAGRPVLVRLMPAHSTEGNRAIASDRAPVLANANPAYVVVSVVDQGPGIPAGEHGRLFDRYYRSPGAVETARGLGLGLYISKGLVAAHGGHIWVESVLGQGTTFSFSLPLALTT